MTLWIIEPQDPLIVRDGRPFHATPGARARSLPFPFPSTTAGGVRTRAGQDENGIFDIENIEDVKKICVRGPLLVEQNDAQEWQFLVPAPADALVFDDKIEEGQIERKWLRPLTLPGGADFDKPDNFTPHIVGLPKPDNRKPSQNAPEFWYWDVFESWLLDPAGQTAPLKPAQLGHNGPQPDRRVHVGINPATFTGIDGALFATSGLTFWQRPEEDSLTAARKLGLAVDVKGNDSSELEIAIGFAPLGGERRLMNWQQTKQSLPTKPNELVQKIKENDGYCRLILLTPTYFKAGWQPDFGADVKLLAAAVANPVVVSGWDFAKHGPKATKRLAPAGSVYFVKVKGDVTQWVKDRWLQPLSDDDEMSKVGFGLTAVGIWDGTAPTMKIDAKEKNNG
ncbi:MAG: type III-B CRISPR module-associated protein Cmr3 [Anaerolineales bacterium]|nr:type III-B CRISPR module-associated protein Cmr3 [Anaerolineales bacterium]